MLESFLQPIDADSIFSSDQLPGALSHHVRINLGFPPDLEGVKLALLGIKDPRLDGLNRGVSLAADEVRKEFYRLMKPKEWYSVADLGNIEAGDTVEDTLFALRTVLLELNEKGITAVLLGGTEELAIHQYRAIKENSPNQEVVYLGRRINVREGNWLNALILDEPNHLFNLTALGYQTYLTEQESLDALERMFFDPVRLGSLRQRLTQAEPVLRNAHQLIVDCGVMRASEFPAVFEAMPNGLLNEEACQLLRFAGLGGRMRALHLCNFNPDYDRDGVSSRQVAQMLWFFLEAYAQQRNEDPRENPDQFLKYRMALKNTHEIVFYKSTVSDRWWMEVPHPRSGKENTIPFAIPCEYEDYLQAADEDLPDRWWRYYQKYSV